MTIINYRQPDNWIKYDPSAVNQALVQAKAAILALQNLPYQKDWVESLQNMELKREVAGTSKIEGADFTEAELDEAIREGSMELLTRSQKQARAAISTYQWIATIGNDKPIDEDLIMEIHRRIVTGADDDHCEPGVLRKDDQNVTFGNPRHRGVPGGTECAAVFKRFVTALGNEFKTHDPLIQALAAHYHLAAMHPFLDGNGRTARALGALMKQRSGLRDTCFISISNYYYDEKKAYLATLAQTRSGNHDLTPFLLFGLKGVESQATRVLRSIQKEVAKAVYRNMMYDLFTRLRTPKKRVIMDRQLGVLRLLLQREKVNLSEMIRLTEKSYLGMKDPRKALFRDLNGLIGLGAIRYEVSEGQPGSLIIDLEWPRKITESDFFKRLNKFPKAKTSLIRSTDTS
ncbi:MAG TPA: Fic family protein [Candidatus Deferrimicrobium sp.]|nr:Fic family protein [Candidatus Deferrimicrobium sp.]